MSSNDAGFPPVGSADVADFGDAELVLRTRSGDTAAFGELWRRHYLSGLTVARSVTSSLDADDLVQEAYTRIYQSILTGGGPTGSFRAYLFTSIRNTAATWGRARRETAVDALDAVEDPATSDQATSDALDHSLTHRAFRSLPTRWQEVLWYSEIEQMKPAEIAPLLGLKPTAVAQLTFRAREGLREAWIQAHLRSVADGSDCQWTIEHLGAYARSNLGRRDRAKIDSHLADCARCAIVASEAKEVSGRLALVLLPLTVGAVGTASYLATIQGGGAPIVALAAMPSSVMQGAVTVFPGVPDFGALAMSAGVGTAGAGTAATSGTAAGGAMAGSAAGAAAATGAGGATAMAGGTAAAGSGAMAGGAAAAGSGAAGSAAVGASAMAGATTTASASAAAAGAASAGAAGALTAAGAGLGAAATAAAAGGGVFSGLSAMVGLATAGLVLAGTVAAGSVLLPGLTPVADTSTDTRTSIVQDSAGSEAATAAAAGPEAGSTSDSTTSDEAVTTPPEAVAPVTPPDDQAPTTTDTVPAAGVPDAVPAEAAVVQAEKPAKPAGPAPSAPATPAKPDHPATPAPTPPGQGGQDPRPASRGPQLPAGSPAITGSSSNAASGADPVTIELTVSGSPGATVQARIRGELRAEGLIDDSGTATLVLQPTAAEVRTGARVELRYVTETHAGPPVGARLSDLL